MRKTGICAIFLLFFCAGVFGRAYAKELVFEGKVIAQVRRDVSVPFPIIVDEVYAGIGDNVQKGQKLLQYHLQDKEIRGIQTELYQGGGASPDWKGRLLDMEKERMDLNAKWKLISELAAKNLASQEEMNNNAKARQLFESRFKNLKGKQKIEEEDFAVRLKELERYLGIKLKAGQKLQNEFYMTAPIAGTIISMSSYARALSQLSGTAFTIAILNPIQIEFLVHESEIPNLYVGQKISVEMASDKEKKFIGKVAMLSWQPTNQAVATPSFYTVWVDAGNPDHFLKPGYKVLVHVELDENRNQ